MCATCGCESAVHEQENGEHLHHRGHHHHHAHHPERAPKAGPIEGPPARGEGAASRTIELQRDVLAHNDHLAAHNREWFAARQISVFNLMSSPGAGKTTLLERTIRELGRTLFVIEGDQETDRDAARIRAAGARAVQVNTGTGCHLDAQMISRALPSLELPRGALLMIENVGNLVCPAMFDLGERGKVVIASVAEGDDKPLKYPHMFRAAGLVVLNKVDLLPYVPFDRARFEAAARSVNPDVEVLPVSALSGEGLPQWYRWLKEGARA
jgi:hydrogenase nickel incorporation protein HypB